MGCSEEGRMWKEQQGRHAHRWSEDLDLQLQETESGQRPSVNLQDCPLQGLWLEPSSAVTLMSVCEDQLSPGLLTNRLWAKAGHHLRCTL